jgi:hypothetical protein
MAGLDRGIIFGAETTLPSWRRTEGSAEHDYGECQLSARSGHSDGRKMTASNGG